MNSTVPVPETTLSKMLDQIEATIKLLGDSRNVAEIFATARIVVRDHYALVKALRRAIQIFEKPEALPESHPLETDSPFIGSRFTRIGNGITLGCISPEASDLLQSVMEAWESHLTDLKKVQGDDYEPGHYGFAYWLIRWSGLVEPSDGAGTKSDVTTRVSFPKFLSEITAILEGKEQEQQALGKPRATITKEPTSDS